MPDLQAISDRIEIDDLITSYTRAVDTLDWQRFDTVFTPDATIDYTASGGIKGTRDEVRDWLAQTLPMFSHMQHYVCQKEVALDGDHAETLLKQADAAMYAGKQSGRNCLRRAAPSKAIV